MNQSGGVVAEQDTGAAGQGEVAADAALTGADSCLLIDNLPGFPDNLSTGDGGRLSIAIPSPRNPLLDRAHARPPWVLRATGQMPKGLQPPPGHTTWFMAVDADGHVAHDLQGRHGYHMASGVREHNASRYLTSLTDSSVAAVSLPPR